LLQNISRLPYQGKVVGALSEIGFDKSTSERPIFSDYILLHSGIYCSSVLRCLRSLPFARENYPTQCMYRRGKYCVGYQRWRLAVSARFLGKAYIKSDRMFYDIADAWASIAVG